MAKKIKHVAGEEAARFSQFYSQLPGELQKMLDAFKVTSFEDLPLFLNVTQLAAALNIGKSAAYNLLRSNQIPCYRFGTQYRVPKENICDLYLGSVDCSR